MSTTIGTHFIDPSDEIKHRKGAIVIGKLTILPDVETAPQQKQDIAARLILAAMELAESTACAYAPCDHSLCAEFGPRECDKR